MRSVAADRPTGVARAGPGSGCLVLVLVFLVLPMLLLAATNPAAGLRRGLIHAAAQS